MLDRTVRKLIDPMLERPARALAAWGVSANSITLTGFLIGMAACASIWQQCYGLALLLVLANRMADGLDGMVARRTGATDTGGFLDIVLDLMFYAGIPFSFGLASPDHRLPACFLIYSFLGTSGSFLACAAISARRGVTSDPDGRKSFFYSVGFMEGTETILFFILFCVLPQHFATLAWIFGSLCWLTTIHRTIAVSLQFARPAVSPQTPAVLQRVVPGPELSDP